MVLVPPKLGPFELLHRLGAGGMAETFLAVRKGPAGFEQRVCIKRILPAYESDQEFVRSFLAEARTSAALRHANIVQVLDFGLSEREGSHFLALELVDGMDLRALIQRGAEFDPELVCLIGSELAAALEHAHAEDEGRPSVVHRDVSPSNVLVSRAGELKLTDFGIARVIGGSHRTASGVIKGKIPYMPPEYIESGRFDARGDLFALGVLLYELCHGRRPFDGDSELDTLRKIAAGERRPFEVDAPAALIACVDRLLQRKPDDRFEDARALLDALPHVPVHQVRRRLAAMVRARQSQLAPIEPGLLLAAGAVVRTLPVTPSPTPAAVEPDGPARAPVLGASAPSPARPRPSMPPRSLALAAARSSAPSPSRLSSLRPSRAALLALAGSLAVLSAVVLIALVRSNPAPANAAPRPPRLPMPAVFVRSAQPSDEPAHPALTPPARAVLPGEIASPPEPPGPSPTHAVAAALPSDAPRTPRPAIAAQPAELYVVVYPFGDVWVDDKHAGQSPLSLRLSPGSHEIAVGEGRARERQTVRLRAGETRNLTFRSPPAAPR